MRPDEIERLVAAKTRELSRRPEADLVAARSALCSRMYELAADGWQRWPDLRAAVLDAMSGKRSPTLAVFDIEDDGTPEWQRAIDLVALLIDVAEEVPSIEAARTGMLTHLEGTFNVVANRRAGQLGRPISETEALAMIDDDPEWRRERAFILGL